MYSLFRIHIIFNTGSIFLMRAKVSERGQITVPKVLRERLGIRPGTVLELKEDQGKLVAFEAAAMDTIDQFFGKLGSDRRTDDVMRELRGNS
jgi:AbrB family looped-hinge helix DNA binding protein